MAEPIGIASGVLTLAAFAFKSSVSLFQTVQSFQRNTKSIRALREGLEELKKVLVSLQELAAGNEAQFGGLRLPLLHCGKACTDFEQLIVDCFQHSTETKSSFRDWAKLQYMGTDINGFKDMLAEYKATISIAIGIVNLRTTTVTSRTLQEFETLLENTTADLQERLAGLNEKLQALQIEAERGTISATIEEGRFREEINSIKECLALCTEASGRAVEVRTNIFEDVSAAQAAHQVIVSTLGDLISARKVAAGVGATQWLGQMSNASVQELAKSRGVDLGGDYRLFKSAQGQDKGIMRFEDQFGCGHKLG